MSYKMFMNMTTQVHAAYMHTGVKFLAINLIAKLNNLLLRLRNIVIFIHSTSECNGRRLTGCGRRRKHWIEIHFSKLSFNPLLFTQ